jgi:hypothetical protein
VWRRQGIPGRKTPLAKDQTHTKVANTVNGKKR